MSDSIRMSYAVDREDDSWMIDIDKKYSDAVREYLIRDGIPQEGANKILLNASKVLGNCPNPENNNECKKTGLVIGKVQSGKTSNFISLTALAFDNGYNLVVVLGGTKKTLLKQNSERIKEYFSSVKNEVFIINTADNRNLINAKKLKQFILSGKKVVIVALKHQQHIGMITDKVFSDDYFKNKATLIIDDEGDEASLNGLVNKGKQTTIYKKIVEMKNSLERHCFVSVTATPEANILIDAIDVLSPDFGVLVEPGEGYCGLDTFHDGNNSHICSISEKEESLLDAGIPESFEKALAMFFVACAIKKSRKNNSKTSMLIHPSQKIADHNNVYDKTQSYIEIWRERAENKDDISYEPLKNILLNAYNQYKDDGADISYSFEEIEDAIIDAIKYCGIHVINGTSADGSEMEFFDYNICIGGALLGRGLTIDGLTITYIIRTSRGAGNVDTVQQRARWFGYKKSYIDLCRVFAVPKIIREFVGIRELEIDLWDTVKMADLQGTRFKDIARVFTLSDDLEMTRRNVARTDKFTYHKWNKQLEFQTIEEYNNSNYNVVNEYRVKNKDKIETVQRGRGLPFLILENIDFKEVKEELLDKYTFSENEKKLTHVMIDKLQVLLKAKNIEPKIDVIWMRFGDTAKHPVDDGIIHNYMVGRRPDDYSKPATYKGDQEEFVKDDVMQLQIHDIEDKYTGRTSLALALYIPKDYLEKLTNLVIRSN